MLNKAYGNTIENQRFIRAAVDHYFNQTKWAIINVGLMYFFFFCVPFMIQIYFNNKIILFLCLSCCFMCQMFFLLCEINQMRVRKWNYCKDPWNYFDLLNITGFMAYMVIRFFNSHTIMPIEGDTRNPTEMAIWVNMNTFMLWSAFQKLLFYLRCHPAFSKMVRLVIQTCFDIIPFLSYTLLSLVLFTILFDISGVKITPDDNTYDHVTPNLLAIFIQVFRNSIGDITTPTYNYWFQGVDKSVVDINWPQGFMILYAWGLFVAHEMFVFIILLNFLIAVISSSYDAVMTLDLIDQYESKSSMFEEAAMMCDFLETVLGFKLSKTCMVFYLQMSVDAGNEDDDVTTGIVKTIQNSIKKHDVEVNQKVKELESYNTLTQQMLEK